jgi:hypothetical protein
MRPAGVIINYQKFKKQIQLIGNKTKILQIKKEEVPYEIEEGIYHR